MSVTFKTGWNRPKLGTTEPYDSSMSNRKKKNFKYTLNNNLKRLQGKVYLSFFTETEVTGALQDAVGRFTDPEVSALINDCIGSSGSVAIDQGTHQVEDATGGGFKLHFDARPSSGKCFHLYVQQKSSGALAVIEASYRSGGSFATVHPN